MMTIPLSPAIRAVLVAAALTAAAASPQAQDSLVRGGTTTQQLTLEPGSNYVSLRVVPSDSSLESIFADVLDQILLVKDSEGTVFAPSYEILALTDWSWKEALFVSVTGSLSLEVTGEEIEPESAIDLPAGWSWIPVFLESSTPVGEALRSILPALTQVDDGAGSIYPSDGTSPELTVLEPGRGYRVHLSQPATLVYGQRPQPPSGVLTVATIEDALALADLEPGQQIVVTDPVRGGEFRVTESSCVPNGGTCYVPTFITQEASASVGTSNAVTLYDGEGDGAIAFESMRMMYGSDPSDVLLGLQLHDHGDGGSRFDPWSRSVSAGRSLRLNTPGPHRVVYRHTTSSLRVERTIESLVLEGQDTKAYVRPEWWGAQRYPSGWSPDERAPGRGEDPTLDPDIVALDATDEVATALNVADALASETGQQHYVVLGGMYGYSGIIQTKEGAPLKGERDGVRDGQGLRVIKGAPWRFWATRPSALADFAQEKRPSDFLQMRGEGWVLVQHGRDAQQARVIDIEIDGNLAENDYVFNQDYRVGSGPSENRIWTNAVDELLQNTPQWNGFSAHSSSPWQAPRNSNALLLNVHIHDFGGNGILGNDWVHFGGSRDLRVGNIARNHPLYGASTAPNTWIDGVEVYGFYWKGGVDPSQARYRNLSFDVEGPSPYTTDPVEEFAGPRNDNLDPSLFLTAAAGGRHYWGEDIVFEGIDIAVRAGAVPRLGYLGYTSGPVTYRDIVLRPHPDEPATSADRKISLVYTGHANQTERSHFRMERVRVAPGVEVAQLASMRSSTNLIDDVTVEGESSVAQIAVRPGATPGKLVALIRNVSQFDDLHVFPTGGGTYKTLGFDILVEGSPGSPGIVNGSRAHSVPLTTNGLDVTDPLVVERCRVAWRDVSFGNFRDKPTLAIQHFERVTFGERTSEDSGSLSSSRLNSGSVDVPTSLFFAPQSPDYVTISGPDASRFTGWTLAPSSTTYAPVLRLSFSGSAPVSVDWSAAIRPIPSNLTGTE